jgi:putative endonuclease
MADHNVLGNNGEALAAGYMREKGYKILHANWREGRYELDIVACMDRQLVIAEVKTRSPNSLLAPEEAVNRKKILRIVTAADRYIRRFDIDMPVRFDIIAITGEKIEHIEDAFYPPAISYG